MVGNPRWEIALEKAAVARIDALRPLWDAQLKAVDEIRAAGIETLAGIARCLTAHGD